MRPEHIVNRVFQEDMSLRYLRAHVERRRGLSDMLWSDAAPDQDTMVHLPPLETFTFLYYLRRCFSQNAYGSARKHYSAAA